MQTKNRKMTPGEYIKYLADNHIKFDLPEDNRKYPGQQCQNDKINYKFRQLHKHIINDIITFCNAYHISIDEIHIEADGLAGSIECGSWQACTDSCLTFDKFSEDYKKAFCTCDKEFLEGKTKQDLDKIKLSQEPFLQSL